MAMKVTCPTCNSHRVTMRWTSVVYVNLDADGLESVGVGGVLGSDPVDIECLDCGRIEEGGPFFPWAQEKVERMLGETRPRTFWRQDTLGVLLDGGFGIYDREA